MEKGLSHFDKEGHAIMVDVTAKEPSFRVAAARGKILTSPSVIKAVAEHTSSKGDVLGVARVAGIMAAKRTSDFIPLCHPLMLANASIAFHISEDNPSIEALCTVKVKGSTGVEMEALTGVTVALLTIYDMCKGMDKSMVMTDIRLLYKEGGKSGVYRYE